MLRNRNPRIWLQARIILYRNPAPRVWDWCSAVGEERRRDERETGEIADTNSTPSEKSTSNLRARHRGGVTSGYVSGAGSVGQPSYSPELAQGVLVLAELARCGRAGLTAAARLAMSALVRVRVRFRTGLASEAYQPACTPPTVVRGRGARIGGPSDYCNLRSSSWQERRGG